MDKKEVEKGLQSKGFVIVCGKKDHRYFIYVTTDGKQTDIKTKTSHGSQKYKKLGSELVSKMAKQCRLKKTEFVDLVNCPLDRESYEKLLQDEGHI